MLNKTNPRLASVHLVGSVPLQDNATVFSCVCSELGDYLTRIPDGETGVRSHWIRWQFSILSKCPQLQIKSTDSSSDTPARVELRDGVAISEIELGPLGYAEAAIASFNEFSMQKRAGRIPSDCRFQVSLPTPLAPIVFYVSSAHQAALEAVYEAKLLGELQEITAAVPHDELAIQWDTAVEFGIIEGAFTSHLDNPLKEIIQRLVRLGNKVPPAVELGYHLCYGDSKHRHFVEPSDATHLVTVANSIASGIGRKLNWIHLPIPRDRFDHSFYRPLGCLNFSNDTELFLGLLHMTDGVEGSMRRIQAAREFVENFGVATECGFGRRPSERILELLEIHARVASRIH